MNSITIRGKAFGGKVETIRCIVDSDGTVRVWDSVAGYYTTCHSLSKTAQARVRKISKEEVTRSVISI